MKMRLADTARDALLVALLLPLNYSREAQLGAKHERPFEDVACHHVASLQ
jgi:hypothetical protein